MASIKVLKNGTILSYDDAAESVKVLHNATIVIRDGRIASIGRDLPSPPPDAEILDVTGHILTPGFVNTHSHMWPTALRTLAPNATLAEYFADFSQNSASVKLFGRGDVRTSCLAGYLEGINGGVTAYVEHAHSNWNMDAVREGYEAAVESGARVWWCQAVEDREGVSADEQYEYIRSLTEKRAHGGQLVSTGIAWDGFGFADEGAVRQKVNLIKEHQFEVMTIHYLGEPWPAGDPGPARASQMALNDLGIPIIWSHAGFITEADRAALRRHDWSVSVTPESEYHYGHGQKTTKKAMDRMSLGVDTNFTFSGDILSQARLWLQSLRKENYQDVLDRGEIPKENPMTVDQAFLLATRQGGHALRDEHLGVLKEGAYADIVAFDGESVNMVGWQDPVAAVILHANVGDIRHVLVNGEFRKRDGELVLKEGSWRDVRAKFADVARKVQSQHAGVSPLGEKFWGVGQYGDVTTLNTVLKDQ